MCGEFGGGDYEGDGDGKVFDPRTVRSRKLYWCRACNGKIAAGAYHAVVPILEDGSMWQLRAHLQCRDVMSEMRYWGPDIVQDEFENDEERGLEALYHHRAVAEWASGLPYQREEADQ